MASTHNVAPVCFCKDCLASAAHPLVPKLVRPPIDNPWATINNPWGTQETQNLVRDLDYRMQKLEVATTKLAEQLSLLVNDVRHIFVMFNANLPPNYRS